MAPFGRILVLAVFFPVQFLLEKLLKNWILQPLVESWFLLSLFLFKILLEKMLKNENFQAFGPILVLVLPFFPKRISIGRR